MLVLFRTMFRREGIELRRYAFDTFFLLLGLYLVFLFLFYGAKALVSVGSGPVTGSLASILIGYFIWSTAVIAYSQLASDLRTESVEGTLEKLSLSKFGLLTVLVVGALSRFAVQLLLMFALLAFMLLSTSTSVDHLHITRVAPVIILTVLPVVGVGFAMGGLAIVFKRVQALLQFLQLVFVGLLAIPLARMPLLKFLPLTFGFDLLKHEAAATRVVTTNDLLFLLAQALFYVLGGLAMFKFLERIARDRGLLGHY